MTIQVYEVPTVDVLNLVPGVTKDSLAYSPGWMNWLRNLVGNEDSFKYRFLVGMMSGPVPASYQVGQTNGYKGALNFALDNDFEFDLSDAWQAGFGMSPQMVCIDNRYNNAPVIFTADSKILQYQRICPPGAMRLFAVPASEPTRFSVTSVGNRWCNLFLFNFPIAPEFTELMEDGQLIPHTAQISTAVATAIWTPATANLRFRLMKYSFDVPANVTLGAAGVNTLTLLDGAAAFGRSHDIYMPAAAEAFDADFSPQYDLMNGYFSIANGNVLNATLTTTLATGAIRIRTLGLEF